MRVEMAAQPGQGGHAQRAFFIRQVRRVVAPHAMLVAHGAAVRGNGARHRGLERLPAPSATTYRHPRALVVSAA